MNLTAEEMNEDFEKEQAANEGGREDKGRSKEEKGKEKEKDWEKGKGKGKEGEVFRNGGKAK